MNEIDTARYVYFRVQQANPNNYLGCGVDWNTIWALQITANPDSHVIAVHKSTGYLTHVASCTCTRPKAKRGKLEVVHECKLQTAIADKHAVFENTYIYTLSAADKDRWKLSYGYDIDRTELTLKPVLGIQIGGGDVASLVPSTTHPSRM